MCKQMPSIQSHQFKNTFKAEILTDIYGCDKSNGSKEVLRLRTNQPTKDGPHSSIHQFWPPRRLNLSPFSFGTQPNQYRWSFFFFFAVVMLKRSNIYIWHVVQISLVLQQNIFDPYGSCITVPPHMVHESVGERKKLWALVIAFNLFLCTMSSSGYFPWSHPWFTLILSQTLSAEACWGVRLTHSLLIKSIAHKQTHMLL